MCVWEGLQSVLSLYPSSENPHWREAVSMCSVWQKLHPALWSSEPSKSPHWSKATNVIPVWNLQHCDQSYRIAESVPRAISSFSETGEKVRKSCLAGRFPAACLWKNKRRCAWGSRRGAEDSFDLGGRNREVIWWEQMSYCIFQQIASVGLWLCFHSTVV